MLQLGTPQGAVAGGSSTERENQLSGYARELLAVRISLR